MKKKRVKNETWIWAIYLGTWLGMLALIILFGDLTVSSRLFLILFFIALGFVLSFFLLNNYFRKSLGRTMRASPSLTRESLTAPSEEPEALRPRSAPARPFAYEVFDKDSLIEIGPAAAALLERGYRHYRMNIYILVAGALYLGFAFLIGSLIRPLMIEGQSTISVELCCGILVAFPISLLIANPNRYPTFWTTWIWRAWNVVLLVPIAWTAIESAVETYRLGGWSLLLSLLATGVLAGYGVLWAVGLAILRREVAAHQPLRFLALWVFNVSGNLFTTFSSAGLIWQFLGSTQYLRGGGFTVDIRDVLSKKEASRVVDTPEELESTLRGFHYAPTWSGRYKVNTVLCGDAVWKSALDALLRETDVVVMSLFGFSPSNQGCLYELGLLVDRLPMQRVLFLIDETTDLDFLIDTLRQSWGTMVVDSPNQTGSASPIRIFRLSIRIYFPSLDRIGSTATDGPMQMIAGVNAPPMSSNPQRWAAREVDNMLRLILQGAVPER